MERTEHHPDPSVLQMRRIGPTAVWLTPCTHSPAALAAAISRLCGEDLREVVPGATSVLVDWHSPELCEQSLTEIASLEVSISNEITAEAEALVCPVIFDGPDLEQTAHRIGLAPEELVELLTSCTLRVAFCGFSPGFGYLTGLPASLHLPRRSTPRTRVPAGSVAIAAGYAAIYPTESPGGWHLLGSCALPLWDIDREPPAAMTPGRTVRFVTAPNSNSLGG